VTVAVRVRVAVNESDNERDRNGIAYHDDSNRNVHSNSIRNRGTFFRGGVIHGGELFTIGIAEEDHELQLPPVGAGAHSGG
jgi:hypothetical protein